jgi:hypothetical protein
MLQGGLDGGSEVGRSMQMNIPPETLRVKRELSCFCALQTACMALSAKHGGEDLDLSPFLRQTVKPPPRTSGF